MKKTDPVEVEKRKSEDRPVGTRRPTGNCWRCPDTRRSRTACNGSPSGRSTSGPHARCTDLRRAAVGTSLVTPSFSSNGQSNVSLVKERFKRKVGIRDSFGFDSFIAWTVGFEMNYVRPIIPLGFELVECHLVAFKLPVKSFHPKNCIR